LKKIAPARLQLGNSLEAQGKLDEAVAVFREVIRLNPDHAEAYCNLGGIYRQKGNYAGSLAMYRQGHELGTKRANWRFPSAQWVAETERLVAMADRLPSLLKGEAQPRDQAERLALAGLCQQTQRNAAARLWAESLEADPKLSDDRRTQHRYNAACSAALAVAGKGKDDPPPDEAAKAKLRAWALDWLKAERDAWAKLLESSPPQARSAIARTLLHWRQDPDLTEIREPQALAKLPEAERMEWLALWAEVDALLARVRGGRP